MAIVIGIVLLVLFIIVIIITSLLIIYRDFKKAAYILNGLHLNQSGNLINPVDVAYISQRGGMSHKAEVLLNKDMGFGVQLVHLSMQILIYSQKNDWEKAQNAMNILESLSKNDTELLEQDRADIDTLRKLVKEKDAEAISKFEYYAYYEDSLVEKCRRLLILLIMIGIIGVLARIAIILFDL